FPTLAAARACYASDEYQQALQHRLGAATAHVVLVDGLPE
ncbi:MAG: DUF1330 domain-containing protein, partial [Rhodobacteraceae bacterium]|nr:DUF1330 domain-containing protein [Paracoccaceae bacterium]